MTAFDHQLASYGKDYKKNVVPEVYGRRYFTSRNERRRYKAWKARLKVAKQKSS